MQWTAPRGHQRRAAVHAALGGMSKHQRFEIIAHLRAPEAARKKQTHESLRPYMLEEAHEALEAIDNGDWQSLSEELGDVLLQVVLHTRVPSIGASSA
ncbi:MAG: MazG nucleotide pyrophosphohydrolase domain-containing protein [Anaerolineae bacterium]